MFVVVFLVSFVVVFIFVVCVVVVVFWGVCCFFNPQKQKHRSAEQILFKPLQGTI